MELQGIVTYSQNTSRNQSGSNTILSTSVNAGLDPYTRLADENGNPLAIIKGYRPKYLAMIADYYGDKILDMTFKPFQDMNEGYSKMKVQDLNLNLNANYKISKVFSASLTYSYNKTLSEQNDLRGGNTFFMRDLINTFTTREDFVDPVEGPQPLKRLIPLGGLYTTNGITTNNQTLRGLLNANKTWGEKHELSAIAGADVNKFVSLNNYNQVYGYNPQTLGSNNNVPYGKVHTRLINDPLGVEFSVIPNTAGYSDFNTRAISFYSNAAYTFDKRYTFSASVRKDISSAFGASTNSGGTPYFSLGGSWNLANERFYKMEWLPVLQLRATYGYNGNVNPSRLAFPLIQYRDASTFGGNMLPDLTLGQDVSNPEFRPEKSGMLNLGLNFGLRNNRLSGSIEYFNRKATDLLSIASIDPSSGYNRPVYNSANLRATGTDISLNAINFAGRNFRWTTNFLFSYNRVKITRLFSPATYTPSQLVNTTQINIEGYDLSRMTAYRWAGLDPNTGDPMGFVNGVATPVTGSDELDKALEASSLESTVRVFGSAVPVYFGALRNTFVYSGFSLSVNFLYKLGYYTRRPVSDLVRYDLMFTDNFPSGAEFAQRWQNPGDEKKTNVPSLRYPTNFSRDEFYRLSEINVVKADHIRLQEINLGYTFKTLNSFIKNPRLYVNINNLGIVWRANKLDIDPDALDYRQPRIYGFGFSANF